MNPPIIKSYDDFCLELIKAGFSMAGGNSSGIFSLISWDWNEPPPYDTPVAWHTGDAQTDPWEWRIRVLEERDDIAYGKLFFSKSGYITKEWYSYFLSARRNKLTMDELYYDGVISHDSKRIYDLIEQNGMLPLHAIKQLGGFTKEDKSKFDRSITELQMKMLITMCGRQQKVSKKGDAYGWSSTAFCTVESFFNQEVFEKADKIPREEAIRKITSQILLLNPEATEKKIKKFIIG